MTTCGRSSIAECRDLSRILRIRPPSSLCLLCALGGSLGFAQNYQVKWSVVDIGGGAMNSTSYQVGSSVGQTAVGQIASTAYQSFIGFWQIDTTQVGVREESHWTVTEPLVTRLFSPYPNPCPAGQPTGIRYSLAHPAQVTITVHNLLGRRVRTLLTARQPAGRYQIGWSLRDDHGLLLGSGVYFLRFRADDYEATSKVIRQ